MDLTTLPDFLLYEVGNNLTLPELNQLCSTNSTLVDRLCNNPEYWRSRYYFEFGNIMIPWCSRKTNSSWKIQYYQRKFGFRVVTQSVSNLSSSQIWSNIPFASIIQIGHNNYSRLFLRANGQVWAVGENSDGQLGSTPSYSTFVQLNEIFEPIQQMGIGSFHTLLLTYSGKVLASGNNLAFQLAEPLNVKERREFEQIIFPESLSIKAVAVYQCSNWALDWQGRVWVWGRNLHRRLYPNGAEKIAKPTEFPDLPRIIAIFPFEFGVIFLDEERRGWIHGTVPLFGPDLLISEHALTFEPVLLQIDRPIFSVVVGRNFILVLTVDGQLRLSISDGSLESWITLQSLPLLIAPIQMITGSDHHVVFLFENGKTKTLKMTDRFGQILPINQLIDQLTNQIVGQVIGQSVSQSVSQSVGQVVDQVVEWIDNQNTTFYFGYSTN